MGLSHTADEPDSRKMKRKKTILILVMIVIGYLSLVSAVNQLGEITLEARPKNVSDDLQPLKTFFYEFNFTTDSACSSVLLQDTATLKADRRGLINYTVDLSGLSSTPSYLCEYRNGTLRKVHYLNHNLFEDKLNISGGTMTGDLNLKDSVNLCFGDSKDMCIYHDGVNSWIDASSGTGFLNIAEDALYIGTGNLANYPVLVLKGNVGNGALYWWANSYLRTFNGFAVGGNMAVGTTPSTGQVMRVLKVFTSAPTSQYQGTFSQFQDKSTTETSYVSFGGQYDNIISNNAGVNNSGRSFKSYYGGNFRAQYEGTQNITWELNQPNFYGGQFSAGYYGTGVLKGPTPGNSPRFTAGYFQSTISAAPVGPVRVDYLRGLYSNTGISAVAGYVNVTEATGIYNRLDTTGGNIEYLTGIRIPGRVGSGNASHVWGINSEENIQVASDKKLIMEGSVTTEGDSFIVFNSTKNEFEFYINGVLEGVINTTGVFAK